MIHNHCWGQRHLESPHASSLFLFYQRVWNRRREDSLQLLSVTIILPLSSNLGCALIIWCTALLTDLLLWRRLPANSTTHIFCGNGKNNIKTISPPIPSSFPLILVGAVKTFKRADHHMLGTCYDPKQGSRWYLPEWHFPGKAVPLQTGFCPKTSSAPLFQSARLWWWGQRLWDSCLPLVPSVLCNAGCYRLFHTHVCSIGTTLRSLFLKNQKCLWTLH